MQSGVRLQGETILTELTSSHSRLSLYQFPSEDQYKQMVLDKTGGLFRMAVGLMQAFAEDKQSQKDFTRLLNKLSLYFQIRDDYLNVAR